MKQYMRPISIIVPTLNEKDNVLSLFKRIHHSLTSAEIPFEIIVLDDHSTDGTGQVVRTANAKYNARLLLKRGKRGKAFSLLEGFEAAEHDLVCMIDGDLQYPPEAIKLMYHKLQYLDADIVITERVDNNSSAIRKLSTKVFNLVFTRMLFGINYDTQSGLKLFRKDVLRSMKLTPSQWSFDLEFIVRALENNYKIISQKISFGERHSGEAKVRLLSSSIEVMKSSLKLWRTSSSRKVRVNYKYLQNWQSKALLFLGVVTPLSLMLSYQAPKADALSVPILSDIAQVLKNNAASTQPTPQADKKAPTVAAVTDPVRDIVDTVVTPTVTPTPTTTTTTTAPASSASVTPAATSTSATPATPTPPTTNASATPTGDTAAQTAQTGKNAAYYKQSNLSSSTTAALHRLAKWIINAGAVCIGVGLLIIFGKKLARKLHHDTVRG